MQIETLQGKGHEGDRSHHRQHPIRRHDSCHARLFDFIVSQTGRPGLLPAVLDAAFLLLLARLFIGPVFFLRNLLGPLVGPFGTLATATGSSTSFLLPSSCSSDPPLQGRWWSPRPPQAARLHTAVSRFIAPGSLSVSSAHMLTLACDAHAARPSYLREVSTLAQESTGFELMDVVAGSTVRRLPALFKRTEFSDRFHLVRYCMHACMETTCPRSRPAGTDDYVRVQYRHETARTLRKLVRNRMLIVSRS
jgi:hypothetical protein